MMNAAKFYKIIVLCMTVVSIFYAFVLYNDLVHGDKRHLDQLELLKMNHRFLDEINATGCSLPQYDLYDPEIKKYIEKPATPILCGRVQPYLTYMDWDGNLHLNNTEQEINRYKALNCTHESVVRDKRNDYKVLYSEAKAIARFPIKIEDSVIRVKCFDGSTPIYRMIHSQIKPLSKEIIEKNNAIPMHRWSVLIFGIDSMSRGNFIRTLPKTYRYLLDMQGMDVFKGLNKVADNTFPNLMALLAGFYGYRNNMPRGDMPHMPVWTVQLNSTKKHYDDMPIIWKTLEKTGYITMYAEEYLDATFSYLDVGFDEDPVHYYYRSSYVSLAENLNDLGRDSLSDNSVWRYCLGNRPTHHYALNYTEEFLTEMANYKYFAFSFLVEMSHHNLNDVKNIDDDLHKFFQKMFNNGMFKNTVVVVMGDHGHRFDDIRKTYIGRIEERMPFLGIILPKNLQVLHPSIKESIKTHTEHLLSWYDIHETLVDLTLDDIGKRALRPNAIGKSVFQFFDENRTCSEIGIRPEYCMCDREAKISASSPKVLHAANLVNEEINKLLQDSDKYLLQGDHRTCAELELKKILSATVSMKSSSHNSTSLFIKVIIEIAPSGALFEATVEDSTQMPRIIGDINRINKYGNQSSCLTDATLRLYCYCI